MQIIIHQALSIKEMQHLLRSEPGIESSFEVPGRARDTSCGRPLHEKTLACHLPVFDDSRPAQNSVSQHFTHTATLFKTAARLRPAVAAARSPKCGQKCRISGLCSTWYKIRPLYGIGTHTYTPDARQTRGKMNGSFLLGWRTTPTTNTFGIMNRLKSRPLHICC